MDRNQILSIIGDGERGGTNMIQAYPKVYLNKVQAMLGDAFDYAVNVCNIEAADFVKMFLGSSVSKQIECGDRAYIQGNSGIDVVLDVVAETTGKQLQVIPQERMERSSEYWIGWAVAYYQWYSDRKYSEIFASVSFAELQQMYHTLHEADISKFVELVDSRIKEHFPETNLKRIRLTYGCTQAELAKRSGVGLRSIQMYEQRNKDINKAAVETVYRLSKVLGCKIEDLIEKA